MRTSTNLLLISLLLGACEDSLPPSPYGGGFGESSDPSTDPDFDAGAPNDAGNEADAGEDGGDDTDGGDDSDGGENDAGEPEIPPLIPKTACDPPRILDDEFDSLTKVYYASNGKGTAALSWSKGEPRKQYASVYRDGTWGSKQELASEAMDSAVLGVDDDGSTYAFWWGADGLSGRKLETASSKWSAMRELDRNADFPLRPEPYMVSPNGVCLFLRDAESERNVVRYTGELARDDELELEAPASSYARDEVTHLLATTAGEAVVLSTWIKDNKRHLVPYFQIEGKMVDADAFEIPETTSTEQVFAAVLPSGDLAVVAADATETQARLWLRRVARDTGKWSKETLLEKRNITESRFALRAALADTRGMLTVAWLDGEDVKIAQETKGGFGAPKTVAVPYPDAASFALDFEGNLSMVYPDTRGGVSLRQLAARDGKLLPPTPISKHLPDLTYVSHDADGNVLIVWEEEGLRAVTCRDGLGE